MWQDESYTSLEEVAYNDGKNYNKVGNEEYAKGYCENLTLDGFSDFRLPNIYELTTLIDNTKSEEPYIVDGIKILLLNFIGHLLQVFLFRLFMDYKFWF